MSREDAPYAIGLDVGGTKIAGGVVALDDGRVLNRRVIATQPERGGAAVLADALALAQALHGDADALGIALQGIGVGVPELVDLTGTITSGHAVEWRGMQVQERFSRLGASVIESDVRAHALAEARFGAGSAFRLFVFVTVGTGISCCLVQDGIPYAGAQGNALILASSPLTTTCTTCGTQLTPVLEDFASGPALVTRYNQISPIGAGRAARAEDVIVAANMGDAAALQIVKTAGAALGASVGWLVNVLDPQALIVGGGLGTTGGLYWESLVAATRAHIWADNSRDIPILMAALGPDAGLVGAAVAAGAAAGQAGADGRLPIAASTVG